SLVVQRNALSSLPQWLSPEPLAPSCSPRAGVGLACAAIPLLPPGGDVQVALQWIPRRRRSQEDLEEPAHVRQRDDVGRFPPPTAGPPVSRTTAPASPTACDGASPTNSAPHSRPVPLPACSARSSLPPASACDPLAPTSATGLPRRRCSGST